MPNLASVLKYFPTPFENTLVMTLNGTIAPGATTVAINNLGNYTNGQVVVFIVDAGTTAKQVFTGTVSGSSVVNVVWTYGTNVSHADGAAIADYVTATDFGMMSKGIQVQHKQDGTHGDVTSTSLVNTGAFTQTGAMSLNGSWDGWVGANESWTFASGTTITVPTDATTKYDPGDFIKITQSATVKYFRIVSLTATVLTVAAINGTDTVANSAITANAYSKVFSPHGPSPAWVSWTPTWTNLSLGNAVLSEAKFTQQGKTVRFKLRLTFGTTTSVSGRIGFSAPVTAAAVTAYIAGMGMADDQAGSSFPLDLTLGSTTLINTAAWQKPGTYVSRVSTTAAIPLAWANGNTLDAWGTYEPA